LEFKLTDNWYIAYDNYYDGKEGKFVSHALDVTRKMHCWELKIKWSKQGDYWDYRLLFENIKLPRSLKFETKDHKRY
jgi:hypothetical protein